ncbi:HAD-IC family P-type ATPase [Candidatus Giovannonibacteria bacterium]|nr:HAD-IC family P-type ATPase [Candidatus Giovannonibacteria bacterium]
MNLAWHSRTLEDIGRELKTDLTNGLSLKEAETRMTSFGKNTLPTGKKLAWWQLFLGQFKNPLVTILLIAAGLTYLLEEYLDTTVIVLAVLVNVFIGFWQEFRSNTIFEKLQKLMQVSAEVLRDGEMREISATEVVPGDIVLLRTGVKIPADIRLIFVKDLEINEALLTGESIAVKKSVADLPEKTTLADRTNMAHTGTVVERGEGKGIVVATGEKTELGQIAKLTASVEDAPTPLQERLSHLGKIISLFVVAAAALILITELWEKRGFVDSFTVAVAIAVAAIPEGLPAALSVVLAVSSQRILNKKGLVKTLLGAETLGSTTVICTDKTGTMTEGIMKVEKIVESDDEEKTNLALALANEAFIVDQKFKGEATDIAKLEYFAAKGGDFKKISLELPRLELMPFNQDLKYIASFHKLVNDKIKIFVSGAPERLLGLADSEKEKKEKISATIDELAKQGYRLIGTAEKTITSADFAGKNEENLRNLITGLSFTGIAAIRDPIRPDVKQSITETKRAGIRTIMITGDHKFTATAIGKDVGFKIGTNSVIEGDELDHWSDAELTQRIGTIEIIARATPKHKMKIIDALRIAGEVVAMTGDGVNDAPALKAADVGVALGAGTDVTKEAADLVLLNDSFSTITAAVKQGRIAFDNIRKVVVFLLANSFTELILVLTALILRIPLPITAVQILWANLVEDGLPNFALAFEPGTNDVMERKPFRRKEPILDKEGLYMVYAVGILTDIFLVGLYLMLYYAGSYTIEHIQTIMFAAVASDSLIYVFSIKNLKISIFRTKIFNNLYLVFAVAAGFILIIASIYVPFLSRFLETVPLGLFEISLVAASGITRLMLIELTKWWFRRKDKIASPAVLQPAN